MAESEEDWIKRRAYALWEEEGYPSGKDREHWERAKLEHATLKPTASNTPPMASPRKKAAAVVKAPKAAAPKAPKTVTKTAPSKPASTGTAAKTTSKTPAAIPAAVEPAKKRSKKVPAGQ
ncbi:MULTISPECIES: DUF2934 domain-containing protein [Rhizobium/Agrobacterium group]|uniref:DUF2934 domain-containing protein n=2 Tax=Neorhizobium TaxID=1525371 RepID=A0ABV0M5Q1_9HYPH|nr:MULTISPECIES: DUF2934 domain-containing protein [Rhizobium/Agrobacterium group]MCC2611667.1 DUF2934 domain-containing protein [Neorhizobium petrolearium]WGI66846.1 DUF2934 domain-containing protein [Neorhizobium petrolearium]